MKRVIPLAVYLGLFAALALIGGCKFIPPKPMKFNNMIARGNDRLADAGKKFKEAADKLDANGARGAYSEADKAVTELTKEFDNVSAPKHGDALLKAYKDFLKKQRQIVDECMKPAVAALEDNAGEKRDRVNALLSNATRIEQDSFRALDAAQSEFCAQKDYSFDRKD